MICVYLNNLILDMFILNIKIINQHIKIKTVLQYLEMEPDKCQFSQRFCTCF